jgi:hypothetical protein
MDDELDIQPWPVLELIGRAVALTSVAKRGMLEVDEGDDVFSRETDRFELSTWARTELSNWITDAELAVLNTPLGSLDEEQMLLADEALYAAGAVTWALRAMDSERLPLPDSESFNTAVMSWAPGPWDKVRNLQKRVRLRSDEELAAERERMELWHWRANGEIEGDDLAEVVAEAVEAGLIEVADGDFATDEKFAFSALGDEERDDIAWIAEQRLRALNWVCGFGESWETAPIELD